MKPDFQRAALEYATIGWRTFPLADGAKLPAIKGGHGVKEASLVPEDIAAWARRFPTANIGIACGLPSGIVVVDVDPRNGGDASLAKHAAQGHVLPPGPTARTGNGGLHYFFRYQPQITNSKNKLGSGIDIKSTGGYVVGSPSWLAPTKDGSGGHYHWITSPFDNPIPRLPIWIITALSPAKRPSMDTHSSSPSFDNDSLGVLTKWVRRASVGNRNDSLYWSACRAAEGILKHKISIREAEASLLREAVAIGLDQKEAVATIRSAFSMVMKGK